MQNPSKSSPEFGMSYNKGFYNFKPNPQMRMPRSQNQPLTPSPSPSLRFSSPYTFETGNSPRQQATLKQFGFNTKKRPAPMPEKNEKNGLAINQKPQPNGQFFVPRQSIENFPATQPTFLPVVPQNKLEGSRCLVGSIEKALQWTRITANTNVELLLDVIGHVENISKGYRSCEIEILLRDITPGPKLRVVFYEIDRKLPDIRIGAIVRVIGAMRSCGRLQAFNIIKSNAAEESTLKHVEFICDRAVAEMVKYQQ